MLGLAENPAWMTGFWSQHTEGVARGVLTEIAKPEGWVVSQAQHPMIKTYYSMSLTQQLHSPQMATHSTPAFTTHGYTPDRCIHHTWSLTQQLFSLHIAIQPAVVFTTHDHSETVQGD